MGLDWGGYTNGGIPQTNPPMLKVEGFWFEPHAGRDFIAMVEWLRVKYPELRGVTPVTGVNRTYQRQVELRQSWCDRGTCSKAATPGTSNHGWARAADFVPAFWRRMQQNEAEIARRFGWIWPVWAKKIVNGKRWEDWHWEHPAMVTTYAGSIPVAGSPLRLGSSGEAARVWQQQLHDAGGFVQVKADGDFGLITEAATKAFQRRYGLSDDGVVGPRTLAAMNKLYEKVAPVPPPPPVELWDKDTAVIFDPASEVDEGMALVLGRALTLHVAPLGHSERVRAALVVGRAAGADLSRYRATAVLSGEDRGKTAELVVARLRSGIRTV